MQDRECIVYASAQCESWVHTLYTCPMTQTPQYQLIRRK